MTTYIMRDGQLVEKHLAEPLHTSNAASYVIRDEMDPTRHMCDNQLYTSKAKFRQTTRAHGCIEVGNETNLLTKPRKPVILDRRQRVDDIRRTIYDLKNKR